MNDKNHPSPESMGIRELFHRIMTEALKSVDPQLLVKRCVKLKDNTLTIQDGAFDLSGYRNIHVLGAGKGVPFLFHGLKEVLGGRINGGLIISIEEHAFAGEKVRFIPGSHPIPDERSLAAGKAMIEYIQNNVGEDDMVFFLLAGGGSALMVYPIPPLQLKDIRRMNMLLLKSGASINEINCVRKHMSGLKGGRLAELISPARIITLFVSDVIDSPLEDIGSGPSIGDSTTFKQAHRVLEKYSLFEKMGRGVGTYFKAGLEGRYPETPEPGSPQFTQNHHVIIGDNSIALGRAKTAADEMGFDAHILTFRDQGNAHAVAKNYASMIKGIVDHGRPFEPPVLLLAGGELTVNVRGSGKGGRNQEFMLALLMELKGVTAPFHILSIGTDGIDGPTDAAGAWIDENSFGKAVEMGLDPRMYLENNNSYHFFKKLGQLIKTGPTHTNVMDLRMFYIGDAN
ncbi:MAG: glycerate kinase [Thermoplasmata archaeon]|nr:glycerate kinase [Thermoplasmata archaeon]